MRICVIARGYPAVTQTFVYEPIRWLLDSGHTVRVVARHRSSRQPGAPPARYTKGIGANMASLLSLAPRTRSTPQWMRHMSALPAARLRARSHFAEIREADWLLAHFGHTGMEWLPVAALAGKPFAVYFHGADATRIPREHPGCYEALYRSGAALLTNSEYLKRVLVADGAPADRVSVVPLAANPLLAAATASLSTSRILSIGRLVEKKGMNDAIDAFARAALGSWWTFDVIGDGPLREQLRARAADLGVADRIAFRGDVDRAATLQALQSASVFLLASRTAAGGETEGTPVAIIEAATCGLPVVSTRHAGIPELLPPDAGDRGYLVDERDVNGLVTALSRLIADERERGRWGAACRGHALRGYSVERHVSGLVEALGRAAVPKLSADARLPPALL